MTSLSFEQQLDRLADGELRPDEYRRVLTQCEADPERWRACALAFVEHQAWHEALAELQPSVATQTTPQKQTRYTWFAPPLTSQRFISLAASLIFAFACGMLLQQSRTPPAPSATFLAGHEQRAEVGGSTHPPLRENRKAHSEKALGENTPMLAENVRRPTQQRPTQQRGSQPLGNVTFVVSGGAEESPQQIKTPVYALKDYNQQWLVSRQQYEELAREARRNGRRFRYRRDLLPVVLQNGRTIVFPIERFEVRPVDLRDYQ